MKLTQEKINKLTEIGKKYGYELCLPPFNNSVNPFYFIGEKPKDEAMRFGKFLLDMKAVETDHNFVKIDGKNYLEIL